MRKLVVAAALTLATPVLHHVKVQPYSWYDRSELRCLADNIYRESRSEPAIGQALVARVTLNRSQKLNESICKTVYKPKQFSWTLEKPKEINRNSPEYLQAIDAAHYAQLLSNYDLYYFHTKQVNPKWNNKLQRVAQVKNHIFYNEKSTKKSLNAN